MAPDTYKVQAMKLYLVRHAEATSKHIGGIRPLTKRGIEQANGMAQFLKPLRLRVQAVWHSGKARAQQTAEIIESAVSCEKGLTDQPGLKPFDRVRPIAEEICRSRGDLMIVGHEPFLGKLASRLLTGKTKTNVLNMAKGCVVCLERPTTGGWQLAWMLTPALAASSRREA
jgi:phosphohistidine phosphatase